MLHTLGFLWLSLSVSSVPLWPLIDEVLFCFLLSDGADEGESQANS